MQSLSEALSYGELTVRSSIGLVVYKFFSMQRHSTGSSRSLAKVLPDENSFGFCIMRRLFLSVGSGGKTMHSLYGVLSFSILLLAPSVFAQGPGGYNPIGPGVDLARNWGPVMHEDAHERGPELANYAGIPLRKERACTGWPGTHRVS